MSKAFTAPWTTAGTPTIGKPVSSQPPGPWRNSALAELWLSNRTGPATKPLAVCRFTDTRPLLDRKLEEISPVEHGVMWIGAYEFLHCMDVPWRVVLNECIELAKEFGGTDGHKYVNAVLNGLAASLRATEVQADKASGKARG